jgi:hypothetical protein
MARCAHPKRAAGGKPAVVKGWECPLAKMSELEQLPKVGTNHRRVKRAAVCNVCWMANEWRSDCEGHTGHECPKSWDPRTKKRWKDLKSRWDAAQEQHAAKHETTKAQQNESATASSSRAEWKVPGAVGQGNVPGAGGAAGIESTFMGAAPEDFSLGAQVQAQ